MPARNTRRFNSRAREGRDRWLVVGRLAFLFQFTRPRGARPPTARRSTRWFMFQFTRPRGARRPQPGQRGWASGFQFTRPRGARPQGPAGTAAVYVSIHAPARGATARPLREASSIQFQFTRPRGARPSTPCPGLGEILFQFTRPRGARPRARGPATPPRCFNSRAREGRDRAGEKSVRGYVVSIHAPARGATPLVRRIVGRTTGFNSRAREGRDRLGGGLLFFRGVSIHAPARGATSTRFIFQFHTTFQFTRPRGARPARRGWRCHGTRFNSRAREGRDILVGS